MFVTLKSFTTETVRHRKLKISARHPHLIFEILNAWHFIANRVCQRMRCVAVVRIMILGVLGLALER
jgi:hypothetical protein